MVYEKKCSNCGQLMEFGGRESLENLPDNAIEFDGSIYCKKCVRELIQFGTDGIIDDIKTLKKKAQKMVYQMGLDIEIDKDVNQP